MLPLRRCLAAGFLRRRPLSMSPVLIHNHLITWKRLHFLSGFWTPQGAPHGEGDPPRTGSQESQGGAALGASVCSGMTPCPSPLAAVPHLSHPRDPHPPT